MSRLLRKLRSSKDGATLVEFGFVAPVFFMMLMGIFDIAHGVYIRSVLEGALQAAGRNAGLESGPDNVADIDTYVEDQVKNVIPSGELTFKRLNYWEFGDVGEEEDYIDSNNNEEYDDNECFFDGNDNAKWDDRGQAGVGGAKDIVLYTVEVNYDHLFPLWKFLGRSQEGTIAASTTLRNQPYATQGTRTVTKICPAAT